MKINENFALSYTFPTCMKSEFLFSVYCWYNLLIMQLYSVYSDGYNKASEAYHQRLKTSKLFAELMSIIEVTIAKLYYTGIVTSGCLFHAG